MSASGYVWVNREEFVGWVDMLRELVVDTEPKDAGYFVAPVHDGVSPAGHLLADMESYL